VESAVSVERAIDRVLNEAGPDDAILVTGSLYVVGAARPHVAKTLP
jgi:folylpolyglutamate synthase/dihydropteroate synthase